MKTTCQRDGCTREARFAIKVLVPTRGWAIETHQPLALILSVVVCRDHFEEADISTFLDDNVRGVMAMMTRGRAPLDFDRAIKQRVRLDSDEYRRFFAMRQSGELRQ